MSLETMTKLATYTVDASGIASVSFSNIPQGYTDLKVMFSTRNGAGSGTYNEVRMTFNGSATGYSGKNTYQIGTTVGSLDTGTTYVIVGASVTTGNAGGAWGTGETYIYNYSGNTAKTLSSEAVTEANTTTNGNIYNQFGCGGWSNSSPITSLTLTSAGSSFVQYSTFTLYGIKNAQKTAGNSIKATGGNIVFDGTYVYHTFTSTGAFVPTQPLSCDYFIVAGGGGGGASTGGGGGAGGYYTSSSSFTTGSSSSIVAIGAGGAGGTNNGSSASAGSQGTASTFLGISRTGGGGGGTSPNIPTYAATTGGSGGGGSRSGSSQPGAAGNAGGYSPVEGYAGGNNWNSGGVYGTGGGGGAGGVGQAGSATYDGTGGVGATSGLVTSYIAAALPSLLVSGVGYIAGGGGGASGDVASLTPTGAPGGYGGGGKGGSGTTYPVAGVAGTGGGGGGGGYFGGYNSGANGGAGVVVIRYKG